jgi:hypothetical protein
LQAIGTFPIAVGCAGALIALVVYTVIRFGFKKCDGSDKDDGYSKCEKYSVVVLVIVFGVLMLYDTFYY